MGRKGRELNMRKYNKRRQVFIIWCVIIIAGLTNVKNVSAKITAMDTKIHFISLSTTSDAILLESNGHFAMVDSGEDWDYPDSDKYPLRDGVTTDKGFEPQVIHYLEQLGVKELDFYIATHSHSDHIGAGDEVIRHFPTKKLYINEYSDEYMTDAHGMDPEDPYYNPNAKENRLWDNQYVYDCIIQAAEETGTEIITDLDLEDNSKYRYLSLGDMEIEIMNFERDRDSDGNIIPVSSENNNCLVTLIKAFNKTVLLTSDVEPFDGDNVKIADQLINKLYTNGDETKEMNAETTIEFPEGDSIHSITEHAKKSMADIVLDLPETRIAPEPSGNQGNTPNTSGKTITLDLMKMCHHGREYNNPSYFLTSLNPKTVVTTGPMNWITEDVRMMEELNGSQIFSTYTNSAAVVATIAPDQITTEYVNITPEWSWIGDSLYYFDSNGKTCYQGRKKQKVNGKIYYFENKGNVLTGIGWWGDDEDTYYITEDGSFSTGWFLELKDHNYYYFDSEGKLQKDCWIDQKYYVDMEGVYQPEQPYPIVGWKKDGDKWWYQNGDTTYPVNEWKHIDGYWYYFNEKGYMQTGWIQLNGVWYYLNSNGKMATDWNIISNKWYYFTPIKGNMVIGWKYIGNNWYYMKSNGAMATGWLLDNSYWYYLMPNGTMVDGWREINNTWYHFNSIGYMDVGWKYIGNKWYYLNPNGAMATGWLLQGGHWFYLHNDGTMAVSWMKMGNKTYYLDSKGIMAIGWKKINNKWYYFDSSGAMVTGWLYESQKWYYLNTDGAMATGRIVLMNKVYYLSASGVWMP